MNTQSNLNIQAHIDLREYYSVSTESIFQELVTTSNKLTIYKHSPHGFHVVLHNKILTRGQAHVPFITNSNKLFYQKDTKCSDPSESSVSPNLLIRTFCYKTRYTNIQQSPPCISFVKNTLSF
jgi:hypothetical protein